MTPEPSLSARRRAQILELLREQGAVSVTEVGKRFSVSPMTARRDLAQLAAQGQATRTHGGIVSPQTRPPEVGFSERLDIGAEAKTALAGAASELVCAHETIFLDSSTTSYFLTARLLGQSRDATLITNCLPIMQLVSAKTSPSLELVAIGGVLRKLTQSFVGPDATRIVREHFADRTFLSVNGFTSDGTVGEADPLEADVKRAMIEQAGEAVLLIDRSKLGVRAVHPVARLSQIDLVVVHGAGKAELRRLRRDSAAVRVLGAA